MIRSSLYQLAVKHSPLQVASVAVKPAAAVLAGKVRAFSLNPEKHVDNVSKNTTPDDDNKQVAMKKTPKSKAPKNEVATSPRYAEDALLRHFDTPLWRQFNSGFDDFFGRDPFAPFFSRRDWDPFTHIMPVLKKFPSFDSTLLRSSPGYEIKEGKSTYQIAIDVPDGVEASDMKVEVEQDGTVLHVSGERKVKKDNRVIQTRFDNHFTIGPNIDTDNLTANLSDGVLIVKAPKLVVEEEKKKTIAITQKPHDLSEEEVLQKSYSDAFDESDFAEAGKTEKAA
jgi:HSP20 family protein